MSASLGFIVEAILGIMGSQSLLHLEALTVRLSVWSVVRSCCLLYLVGSGVTLPFGAPLLIFCRPHKFFTVSKKKKKKVATFFSVFLIGFLPPWSFLYPQIFFSRRPNAKLVEIWYILLLCQKIFRLKNCKFGNMPPP